MSVDESTCRAGTLTSGRSSYAVLMAPQRPEATTATAPIKSTTINPKNHITGPIVPCRTSQPHKRPGDSASVGAQPTLLAPFARLRTVRLRDITRSRSRGFLRRRVGHLAGLDDVADRLVNVVGDGEHVQVGGRDLAVLEHRVAHPVDQPTPVRRTEQFVQRAESARHYDEPLRVLHEHRLAGEEVAEVHADVDPLVQAVLEGQLD